MRSAIYGPDVLLLANKKPRIKELIERSRSMTVDEIKALPEKPDVIRGLLLINQFSDQQEKSSIAEKIAGAMQRSHVDQPRGDELGCQIFKITAAGENWLKTGSTTLELKEGWHWALVENGIVYLAGSPIKSDQTTVRALMAVSQYLKQGTLAEFKILEHERRKTLV